MTTYTITSGTSGGFTLNQGDTPSALDTGTATSVVVNVGAEAFVYAGGTISGTEVNGDTSGYPYGYYGLPYGYLFVSAGGTALATTISSGGVMNVSSGGVAIVTTISQGGRSIVWAQGLASATTILSGGLETVSGGATYGTVVDS